MKKEMLSLNSWIKEAAEWQQPLDEFLIDYNMRELECSQEDLLAKMQEMLDVMEKSVEHGLSGVRSHSGLTGGDAKKLSGRSRTARRAGIWLRIAGFLGGREFSCAPAVLRF